jgi:hypothetical protein
MTNDLTTAEICLKLYEDRSIRQSIVNILIYYIRHKTNSIELLNSHVSSLSPPTSSSHTHPIMPPALLTAVDSTRHVHLVIGSNPLAGARCTKSLEVGAVVKLIAPADATLHYGLMKRIDEKEVEWIKRDFQDEDLEMLGREEVDHVVDAVFVTLGPKHTSCE